MIGQKLNNRYTITARLGKGAMGTVYRATDAQTGQDAALKIIASDLALDPAMLERFKREGEALQKLKHPNIVGFQDAFEHDEQYVIVMEYVPGGSLYELIKAGPLPIERASQIALDLCDALIRAHRLNIIHRDIKPENVLIAEDGTPKLADFGVARLSEGTRMTRTGTKVGTPYYMAPEAWKGETIDAQADIWSLGVVMYEMLAGKVPFDGDSEFSVMTKVCTTPPPDLKKLRKEVPSGLIKIITRRDTLRSDSGEACSCDNGTYTLTVGNDDPNGAGTGAYRIKIWDLPPPDEFTINLDDEISRDVPGTGAGYIENPGSNDIYTFTADSGQDVYFQVKEPPQTNDTINWRAEDDQGNELFNTCLGCGDPGLLTLDCGGEGSRFRTAFPVAAEVTNDDNARKTQTFIQFKS